MFFCDSCSSIDTYCNNARSWHTSIAALLKTVDQSNRREPDKKRLSEPKQSGVPVASPSGDSVGVDAFQHVNHIDREAQGAHSRYFPKQQYPDVLGCGSDRERGAVAADGRRAVARATKRDASGARNAREGGETLDSTRKNNLCIFLGVGCTDIISR